MNQSTSYQKLPNYKKKKKRRLKKITKRQKTINEMAKVISYLSIIILNVYGLNWLHLIWSI